MENEVPSRSLTIYLAKEDRRPHTLLRSREDLIEKKIPVGGRVFGRLFIKPPSGKPPSWVSFFEPYVTPADVGDVKSSSAVLLVPVYKRWAAVTFGQGRHLLVSDAFEDQFGLKVALNCINENNLRSIDKLTFDAIATHTKEQANQEANAREFGFDVERDMLRAVTGRPRHKDYGNRLTGKDALNASVQIELSQLHDQLEIYYQKFFDTLYRTSFPWVDNIRAVTDSDVQDELNSLVVQMVRERSIDKCWLAVPELIDWSRVSGFRYSLAGDRSEYYDVHLDKFLEALKNPSEVSISIFRTRRVYCMGENDEIITTWPVFNCLYCEIDHDGSSYVLNAGKWYAIQNDFVKMVNESFTRVPVYGGSFVDFDDENEARYNERLVRFGAGRYFLMDRNLTYHGGPVEFCDVFSSERELIHIKRYGGSATLSHLFFQGVVSAEFFQMDATYRNLIRDKVPSGFRKLIPEARPAVNEYHVVFGIISRSDKDLTVPFFSRVGLRHALRRLEGFGYKVSLAKIGVKPERKLRQRIRPKIKGEPVKSSLPK